MSTNITVSVSITLDKLQILLYNGKWRGNQYFIYRKHNIPMYINSINNNVSFKQVQRISPNEHKTGIVRTHKDKYSTDKGTDHRARIALGAFAGAIAPVIAINALKKGKLENLKTAFTNNLPAKDKFKAAWDMLEIENYTQILATTTGGVVGGLLEGLKYSKTKKDKEAKYKEGIFEFLNNMTPTTFVALGAYYSQKTGKLKSIPAKALLILGSVVGGMYIANKTSNIINQKIFDKNKSQKEVRHFKPTDCLVHADDLLNLAVLTKIPLASKLQIDKLLPFIYARSGYEVATAKVNNLQDHN